MSELRKIKAKFDSKCLRCQQATLTGSTVFWDKGVGVYHENCSPDTSVPKRTTEVCANFESVICCVLCRKKPSFCTNCKKHHEVIA